MNLNVKDGLWVIMFIDCNKYITEVQDVSSGGVCACVGAGVRGNSLYLPVNFAVNLKLLYKIKFMN